MQMEHHNSRDNFRMLTAFGMILLIFSLFLGRETVWIPCRQAFSACHWDTVPATVVSSRIATASRSGFCAFQIDYRYEYGGIHYGSTRYVFFPDELPREAETLVPLLRKYPAGEEITCYVDPASPMEAVIDRSIPWYYFARGAAVLAGMVLGLALFLYAWKIRRKERKNTAGLTGENCADN